MLQTCVVCLFLEVCPQSWLPTRDQEVVARQRAIHGAGVDACVQQCNTVDKGAQLHVLEGLRCQVWAAVGRVVRAQRQIHQHATFDASHQR